jgi:hypothetical protein
MQDEWEIQTTIGGSHLGSGTADLGPWFLPETGLASTGGGFIL